MVDQYKPHLSGVTSYVSLNKRWLEAQGHRVFVFTFGDQDYEDDELYVVRSPGLPVNVNDRGFHLSLRYSPPARRKLLTMDVVHAHDAFLSGPLMLRYCLPAGIPVVFTNHTRYDLYAQHYLPAMVPDVVTTTFLKAYLPNFCAQCHLVVAPSAGTAEVMRTLGVQSAIQVIPNGVDLGPYAAPPPISRAEAGLPEAAVVLMYTGRLSPEKNLVFLLRAFFGVAAACPDVVLALVGEGGEMETLRAVAAQSGFSDRVCFLGRVAYAQVPAYLQLADVFVTASQTEVHPFSLIEALASGVPALGIASPGIGDTIVDGENGLLSSPDIAAFTAKLTRLVMEPETRRRMGQAARASAQLYDINRTAQAVLDAYQRLATERQQKMSGWDRFRQGLRQWFGPRPAEEQA
jgi:glycosyltransferase involved in cell wall biosynthesis